MISIYQDIFLTNKLIVFSYFSGSKSFLTCGANNTSRILCLHPWWKGQRIFLEETNIQDYRTLRWTYPWLFQDCWILKTIGIMLNIEREEYFHYNKTYFSSSKNWCERAYLLFLHQNWWIPKLNLSLIVCT